MKEESLLLLSDLQKLINQVVLIDYTIIILGGIFMTEKSFIRADEVAEELDVSKSYAYKVIKQLNDELSAKGYITVAGRISRQYFNERVYGAERREV